VNGVRPDLAPPRLSIVIPALNEERTLPALLDDLGALPFTTRIVVADGGSTDSTAHQARDRGARVVRTPRGRAAQMNVGASSTSSPWLLFLHADSRLPPESREALAGWLESPPETEAAYFRFQLDAHGPWWRLIEQGQRLRERLTGLAYGDQGLLVSRRRWRAMGGIPELPLMEDVEAVRRLRLTGGIHRIEAPLVTSARRYRSEGPFAGFLRNAALISLYGSGVPPERLARWYRPHTPHREEGTPGARSVADPAGSHHAAGSEGRLLLVFAKAPRQGQVKTRLAADIGDERATEIYRSMGRNIVDALRGGRYRIRICFTPADAQTEIEDWLGPRGMEFAPQTPGDLGERMSASFDEAFLTASRVAIVGTDAPGLSRALVERAFDLLDGSAAGPGEGGPGDTGPGEEAGPGKAGPGETGLGESASGSTSKSPVRGCDAVIGPARDGGYYLLALRRPAPALFRDIPWSTERVLEGSLARAESEGLRVRTLPALPDVDRLEDLTHLPPGPPR
jgi:rSAM/selenodomain-associated transferase 2